MASDGPSRIRVAVVLVIVAGFLVPTVTTWVQLVELPTVGTELLVRLVGLGIVVTIALLLVRQKRRSRGQQASEDAPEQASDRDIEGSGEVYAPYVYNNQQQARREGKRIQQRAEEVAEADREARKRR